ncbi:cell death-inducing p53-target protein 1 homolog [Haliotis cracherodii]|uniref:cell death-inducing p53-target protein 1 homolog n=1 Tax=Haliotis cracherodii TaxID=6455 RepID=UPI0039E73C74
MADDKTPGGMNQPPPVAYPQGAPPPYGQGPQPQPYPQAGGYPQAGAYLQGQQQTTVVLQQPGYGIGPVPGSAMRYRTAPALIICQHCNATVTTSMTYETGLLTWAAAGLICLFGCWLGCCLIPFCVDASKDVNHSCPNCQQIVGKFRQFS